MFFKKMKPIMKAAYCVAYLTLFVTVLCQIALSM